MDNLQNFEPTIIKLAKTYYIPPLEWQDIAQELRINLWEQEQRQTKPIKSYKDWAYITCRNKIRKLARYYQAQKRDGRKIVSLEALTEQGIDFEG